MERGVGERGGVSGPVRSCAGRNEPTVDRPRPIFRKAPRLRMKADYLSYQRATSRSLLGLGIQLALGLALLIYGVLGGEPAARYAATFVLIGVPVWLSLAVIFDQHRRERIEAIEAEAFAASDAASSSVFEQQADDLRVAAKRLKMLYKYMIPGVSLLVGGLMVGLGFWLLSGARFGLKSDSFRPAPLYGWAMAVGLSTALVGFLYARYTSSMGKQKVWTNLRGGAAFAAGAALLGLTLAIGHAVQQVTGQVAVLRYLPMAFSLFLIAMGAEVFLNFVLDVYRPRKPGEFPRPAFESRVLGFVAAPDRIAASIGEAINYQFGYDVSSSWVYLLLSRTVFKVLLPVAVIAMWAMSSLVVIRPHERGMVLRFGKISRVIEPGLSLKWPWPIERVEIPEYTRRDAMGRVEFSSHTVTGVRTLNIGSVPPANDGKPILWTNDHATKEIFFMVQPGGSAGSAAAQRSAEGRASDLALLAIEVPLHYSIEDVEKYERLAPPEMRDELLKAVAQRVVTQYASSRSVGELLSAQRDQLQHELRSRLDAAFANLNPDASGKPMGAGVKVLFMGVDGIHPPKDTATAFEQVVGAEQKYHAKLKSARGEAIKKLTAAVGSVELANQIVAELDTLASLSGVDKDGNPNPAVTEQQIKIRELIEKAGGKAASLILEASADRWQRHMGERARLAAYQGQLGTFKAAPSIYKASLYLDAMRAAMEGARVFVVDSPAKVKIRGNYEDRESMSDVFQTQEPKTDY